MYFWTVYGFPAIWITAITRLCGICGGLFSSPPPSPIMSSMPGNPPISPSSSISSEAFKISSSVILVHTPVRSLCRFSSLSAVRLDTSPAFRAVTTFSVPLLARSLRSWSLGFEQIFLRSSLVRSVIGKRCSYRSHAHHYLSNIRHGRFELNRLLRKFC